MSGGTPTCCSIRAPAWSSVAAARSSSRAREADLLEVLLRRPGHVVTRRAALAAVWGDSRAVSDNVVDRYIAYVRRKLGDPPLIHTVRGAGYVLRR